MAAKMASKAPSNKKLLFIFAYVLGWLSGIIVYVTAGQTDKRLKFHALQAIFIGAAMFILMFFLDFIPFVGLLGWLVWLYGLYLGYEGYEGEDILAPVLGDYAKQYAK